MNLKHYLFFIFIFIALFSSCIIEMAEEEYYSIYLNGTWLRENETVLNNNETLTFIDNENLKYRINSDTTYYRFSFYFDELSIYSSIDDSLLGKSKVKIINMYKKFEIRDTLNTKFHLLNGTWKKYQ